jgi:ATP-dependent Lon protease
MNGTALVKEVNQLKKQVEKASLPLELQAKVFQMIERLNRMAQHGNYSNEYDRVSHYVDWVTNLPWNNISQDLVDLKKAEQILNKHHYGLDEIKERILEYLAVLKLNQDKKVTRAPILCLVGLVGTGKTSLGPSLAEAIGRKFVRIPFGGMGSVLDLRGQSQLHPEAEPGQLIKALRRAQTKNPIIMLDEIDRVAEQTRSDIMGVLIELLDPEQNNQFIDHFIDYPFDLSNVLFISTANNTTNIWPRLCFS